MCVDKKLLILLVSVHFLQVYFIKRINYQKIESELVNRSYKVTGTSWRQHPSYIVNPLAGATLVSFICLNLFSSSYMYNNNMYKTYILNRYVKWMKIIVQILEKCFQQKKRKTVILSILNESYFFVCFFHSAKILSNHLQTSRLDYNAVK